MNIYTYIHNSVLNLTKPWINNLWSAARVLFIFLLYEWLYLKSWVIFFLLSGLHPYGCFLGIVAPSSWTLFVFTTMVIGLCGRWLAFVVGDLPLQLLSHLFPDGYYQTSNMDSCLMDSSCSLCTCPTILADTSLLLVWLWTSHKFIYTHTNTC